MSPMVMGIVALSIGAVALIGLVVLLFKTGVLGGGGKSKGAVEIKQASTNARPTSKKSTSAASGGLLSQAPLQQTGTDALLATQMANNAVDSDDSTKGHHHHTSNDHHSSHDSGSSDGGGSSD